MMCTACGARTEKRVETRKYDAGLDELITVPGVVVRHCPDCGEEHVGIRKTKQLHEYLAQKVAQKREKLTPKEIRYLRTWLGHSSSDLAKKFDVAPETVSRWESAASPAPMGPANERLLRLLVMFGDRVRDYPLEEVARDDAKPVKVRMKPYISEWCEETAPA